MARQERGVILEVPFFRQECGIRCGPACLRMLVAKLGVATQEPELMRLSGTDLLGTSAEGLVEAAAQMGLPAEVIWAAPPVRLERTLGQGMPFMALVDAGRLRPGGSPRHWVLVVGMRDLQVFYHDPEVGACQETSYVGFWDAWVECQYVGVSVWEPGR